MIPIGIDIQWGESVDAIKKDKMITYTILALVALIMVGMLLIFAIYVNGTITEDQMLMTTTALSSGMFLIVIVYALISYKNQATLKEYKRMKEELEDEKKED